MGLTRLLAVFAAVLSESGRQVGVRRKAEGNRQGPFRERVATAGRDAAAPAGAGWLGRAKTCPCLVAKTFRILVL